jgi:AraC-like DNA-binding protein
MDRQAAKNMSPDTHAKAFEVARHDDRRVLRDAAYVRNVRRLIRRQLMQGEPTVELLAAAVCDRPRTMQRRLATEGTSFSRLLDDVRKEQARKQLKDASKQVGLIAAELGYSGRPAFVRAVRRWFGLSPREIRNRTNPELLE